MQTVDLLRGAWLSLMCGMAYTKVLFRRMILKQKHPLCWPVDLEMLTAGFRVSICWGNLATLRMLLGVMAHPLLLLGIRVQVIQPPGCEPCFWLRLRTHTSNMKHPGISKRSSNAAGKVVEQPDVLLCYVHGGAFVAGHPLMCARTLQRWLQQLDQQGLHAEALCISYPLAPEHPFPAAVASTAAAYAWIAQQFPDSCSTTIIAVGDSAGGNITVTALAALRDYLQNGAGDSSFQSTQTVPRAPPAPPGQFRAGADHCAASSSQQDINPCSIHPGDSAIAGPTGEDSKSLEVAAAAHDSKWGVQSTCMSGQEAQPTEWECSAAARTTPTGTAACLTLGTWDPAATSLCQHTAPSAPIHSDLSLDLPTGCNQLAESSVLDVQVQLFADLHRRLTDMSAQVASTGISSSGRLTALPSSSTAGAPRMDPQMPSAIILVSPATDVSPSACFRSQRTLMHSSHDVTQARAEDAAAADGPGSSIKKATQPPPQQQQTAAAASCLQQVQQNSDKQSDGAPGSMLNCRGASILGSTGRVPHDRRPHYDYLPENLEASGMGAYAAHPGHLCCAYASPVHLASLCGLCSGRTMVLSGGVELLAPDVNRFVAKLQQQLGEAAVVHHIEELLPHSWAMLPLPSMWPYQQSVVRFIAEEHAAAVKGMAGSLRGS